jgi:hypothetical protein
MPVDRLAIVVRQLPVDIRRDERVDGFAATHVSW